VLRHAALLEREQELAGILVSIAEACEGAGRIVIVQGPAGIGKTHLLFEARTQAERAGMQVLAARGSELEREFAYGLVRQLFEPVLAHASEDERAKLLAGVARQATALLGYADPIAAAEQGSNASFATLHGVYWLTANLCARKPLLLVVDDLHWGDVASLRFLAHLLPRLDGLPLLVMVALRPVAPSTSQYLVAQILTDPLATLLRLAPLSQSGSARLVRTLLDDDADEAFCAACHAATGGNPLLLHELTSIVSVEGMTPDAAGAARVAKLGYRAIGQRVTLHLAQLGTRASALCGAVAVLGEDAEPTVAASIAGLELAEALETARDLAAIEILRPHTPFGFVHPLVRDAVYEGLSLVERTQGHMRAVQLLLAAGAEPERMAAHLLLIPPAGDERAVTILRRAAEQALSRGSPEAAVAYLERCLLEPPSPEQRAEILVQVGATAQLVDMAKSVDHLQAALTLVQNCEQRALIAEMLGNALNLVGRYDEAVEVYAQAAEALGEEHADLLRRLNAGLLTVALSAPAVGQLAAGPLTEGSDEGLGSRMLDCLIALHEALAGVPADTVVPRVRRGLRDGALLQHAYGSTPFLSGCNVLMGADLEEVMPLLDAALAEAHLRGSIFAFGTLKCFRALAWLWRGFLTEAEADAQDAMHAITTARLDIGRPLAAAFLADILMEQGRLEEATAALAWIDIPNPTPATGHWYRVLESHARLLMLQKRTEESLETMLACGRSYSVHGRDNPFLVSWRSGAALALLALDRRYEARTLAVEELMLARRWGAPRTLGHALWVAGLIERGESGLDLMREAVTVLKSSPARLEYAKALIELGAALRRSGQRVTSREHLRQGLALAELCGAAPLVKRARTELRATGARLSRTERSGVATLTPSELRVAELAAAGSSNRDIAQALYVSTKTVEVHLTRVYRKLGVTGRAGLAQALVTLASSSAEKTS
jgi:DNA-binding CsgD family transcriptional regulator